MQRARRWTLSALVLGLALLGGAGVAPFSLPPTRHAAAVGWPVSNAAVIAEVVTGGASASDEYVELANAGTTTIDLQNVELIYISAAGTSPARKVAWTASRPLSPGQHLLVANGAGSFAAGADATYSGGMAATGGTVALRVIGGPVVDAVGWGDATNAFVEGAAAAAPAASSSIERAPGGAGGNGTDTNDNSADFVVQAQPVVQNLAAPPVLPPSPTPSATPAPTAPPVPTPTDPPATPDPTSTPVPTDEPSPVVTPPAPTEPPVSATLPVPTDTPAPTEPPVSATSLPAPTDTPAPTEMPTPPLPAPTDTPAPTESAPTQEPATPSPAATPTPSIDPTTPPPSIVAVPVAEARAAADGSFVTIEAVLTTSLGALDGGRGAFVQDATGGIGLYLDTAAVQPMPRGTLVRVTGTLDQRYAQRVLRVAVSDIVDLGGDALPGSVVVPSGEAAEAYEALLVTVEGTMIGSASDVADGVSFTIDDGSGQVRVIVGATPAGLGSGVLVRATGPLGQRDSSGTGSAGYRVYALDPTDVTILVPATPSPTAPPSASPPPSDSPTASPTPSASPSASPSPSELPVISISAARGAPIGSRVHIRGVVTAEVGRVGASLASIQDLSGGIAVHLPAPATVLLRGTVLDVAGTLAAPYGQLEIRPDASTWQVDGSAEIPAPLGLGDALEESHEGLLVAVEGVVAAAPTTSSSGDVSFDIDLAGGARLRIQADVSSGVEAGMLHREMPYRLAGVVGQHASALGQLDGYRIWLRGPDDVVALAAPSPSASASPSPTPTPSPTPSPSGADSPSPSSSPTTPPVVSIASAILSGVPATVTGIVTAGTGLLTTGGRIVVIQDPTAAIQVRLPGASGQVRPGRSLEVTGRLGRSYGAPRMLASAVRDLGPEAVPAPLVVSTPPTAALEWRLVRTTGIVQSLRRSGGSWRADVLVDGASMLVQALTGAAIPADRVRIGSKVTVTGIVRRPYPTARDRRFAILPRSPADLTVSAGAPTAADTSGGPTSRPKRATTSSTHPSRTTHPGTAGTVAPSPAPEPLDIDLSDLPANAGRLVRVGGLIVSIGAESFILDDGTGTATADLSGEALVLLPQLTPGLAVNLIGTAETGPGARLAVSRAEDIRPIADPGAAVDSSATPEASSASSSGDPADALRLSGAEETAGEVPPAGNVPLLVGLLLALALVGVVALLLGRRPAPRLMAHPLPNSRR